MDKIFAFHGGTQPPENEYQSAQRPIASAPLIEVLQQLIATFRRPVVEHQS